MATLTHAGGVVTSRRGGKRMVLLVRASKPPHDWVLPKGHIEKGETAEETAQREVLEESGVDAVIVAPLGDVAFQYKRRKVRVRYFLMRSRAMRTALEDREICWCSAAVAIRRLTHDNVRDIVRLAAVRKNTKRRRV